MPERSGSGVPTGVTPNRAQGPAPRRLLGRFPGRPALKRLALKRLALITLVSGCAWAGWGLGQRHGNPSGSAEEQLQLKAQTEVGQLQGRLGRGAATALDRQRLLSLLLGLGRQAEAIAL
ncbi:MAG: hypothetical protein WCO50_08775, partial [Synechococcus sp. ELA619]